MKQRFIYLFQRYFDKTCSAQEKEELLGYLLQSQYDDSLRQLLVDTWEHEIPDYKQDDEKADAIFHTIINSMEKPKVKRIFILRRIAVAASIILAIGIGSYLLFINKSGKQTEIVKTTPADVSAPDKTKAQITLADGRTIYLDSATNGELVQQGNIKLVKLDNGQIAYQTASGEIIKEVQYNTLTNPRGSKVIDMELSDGSRVWLNAGSSVTYPVAFVDNERKVSITGEAYFEVAHDLNKPFIVSKGETAVQVLGTHFNVNAYDDESDIKVTLLEGSVKVSKGNESSLLKPGQQANVNNTINVINGADLDQVIAWKNGKFSFSNSDLKAIMREVMRWYDVEVVYEGNVADRFFTADISREKSLASMLKIFEQSNISFEIEGKKIIVRK